MRIVVLGGGTVGRSIASLLCVHRHSVTVVDNSVENVAEINEMLDVKALVGSASQSSILFQAGVMNADLCLAVTGEDEVNLVAASMAKAMGARRTVARVFAPVFRDTSTFDYQHHFRVDRLLSLEHLSALEFARGIRHPSSILVENLSMGDLEVLEFEATKDMRSRGVALNKMRLPKGLRIGTITRDGKTWIAGAHDQIELGDRVCVLGQGDAIETAKELFRGGNDGKQGVVIAGGGETGYHLAKALESSRYAVVLLERDRERCEFLASNLKHATVIHSDATRRANLEEERVDSADVFVAATGDDENNIMASVEARDLGAKTVMAVVSRPDYAHVVGKLGIDLAVSPREVMAKQVLAYLHTGPVISRTTLGSGGINVMEMEVLENSPASTHVLANLNLPQGCLVAALIQEGYAKIPGADDRLQVGNTVIALVDDAAIEPVVQAFGGN